MAQIIIKPYYLFFERTPLKWALTLEVNDRNKTELYPGKHLKCF